MPTTTTFWTIAIIGSLLIHASLLLSIQHKRESGALDLGTGGIHASIVELKQSIKGSKSSDTKSTSEAQDQAKPTPKPVVKKTPNKAIKKPKITKPVIAVKEKLPNEVQPTVEPLDTKSMANNIQSDDVSKETNNQLLVKSTPANTGSNYTGGTSTQTNLGGAEKQAKSEYLALLKSILEKEKRYPERARKRRQEGIVYLWFKIDNNGVLLEYKIKESSGYKILDKEVEKLITRVAPFPKFPSDIETVSMNITIPMSFRIK